MEVKFTDWDAARTFQFAEVVVLDGDFEYAIDNISIIDNNNKTLNMTAKLRKVREEERFRRKISNNTVYMPETG